MKEDKVKLKEILKLHKMWLNNEEGGVQADLRRSDLSYAAFRNVDLRRSILSYSDLRVSKLSYADLQGSCLKGARLNCADLEGATLTNSDLQKATLKGADLRGSDLSGSNLDFSCWPLWCGSLGVKLDNDQLAQQAYHTGYNFPPELRKQEWVKGFFEFANTWSGIKRYGLKKLSVEENYTMSKK